MCIYKQRRPNHPPNISLLNKYHVFTVTECVLFFFFLRIRGTALAPDRNDLFDLKRLYYIQRVNRPCVF